MLPKSFSINIILFAIVFTLFCTSCVHLLKSRKNIADKIAKTNNLSYKEIQGKVFKIATYYKITDTNKPIYIYFEGDGFAWVSRSQISRDPTPYNPVALKLASIDFHENIIYIARPCQYIYNDACESKYWSNARFSTEIIQDIIYTLNILIAPNINQDLHLIGFSGGGAVSILVANFINNIKNNVKSITTVAGNLDIVEHSKHHKVSPLDLSMNPVDFLNNVKNIPQIHYVGEKDRIILTYMTKDFTNKINQLNREEICASFNIIKKATHLKGWAEIWSQIITKKIKCINKAPI